MFRRSLRLIFAMGLLFVLGCAISYVASHPLAANLPDRWSAPGAKTPDEIFQAEGRVLGGKFQDDGVCVLRFYKILDSNGVWKKVSVQFLSGTSALEVIHRMETAQSSHNDRETIIAKQTRGLKSVTAVIHALNAVQIWVPLGKDIILNIGEEETQEPALCDKILALLPLEQWAIKYQQSK